MTKLSDLAAIKPGSYDLTVRVPWWRFWQTEKHRGWLHVSNDNTGNTDIMWTTDKDTHFALCKARSLKISASGELIEYFESVLSMWLVWGHGVGGESEKARALAFANWVRQSSHKTPS